MQLRLASIGFGNVGRALALLVAQKAEALRSEHDLTLAYTGAYTRSASGWIAPEGIAAAVLSASGWPRGGSAIQLPGATPFAGDGVAFATQCPADIVLELSTLAPQDGQPALDHVRAALRAGKHVVTANKGPIAYGYRELRALAAERNLRLRFESTVMDGTPIFGMAEASLPVSEIRGFRGVLNATSNYVLGRMAQGDTLAAAVAGAQQRGVAEADPSNDLDGWDAAVKATVLANVLMGADIRPTDVERVELGAAAMQQAQAALRPGQTLQQVVVARRVGATVVASVQLSALPPDAVLAHLNGMESALVLETDTLGDLTLIEGDGGPEQTAFGVLADVVAIARQIRK